MALSTQNSPELTQEQVQPASGAVQQSSDLHFTGFTLSELVVLWRYRVRTA